MNLIELRKKIEELKKIPEENWDYGIYKEFEGIKQTFEATETLFGVYVRNCVCVNCEKTEKEWQNIKELLK